ncbi:hypothetical protein Hanom_Chr16g01476221 [Helianthus anomalus]
MIFLIWTTSKFQNMYTFNERIRRYMKLDSFNSSYSNKVGNFGSRHLSKRMPKRPKRYQNKMFNPISY